MLVFAAALERTLRPGRGRRPAAVVAGLLAVAVAIAGAGGIAVGAVAVPPAEALQAVLTGGGGRTLAARIVWEVRLPRVLLAATVGAGLAAAGAVIQAVVRNPLGDPSLIGVTPGASLGAVAVVVLGAGGLPLSPAAFVGAVATFALVLTIGRQGGTWPPARLILAGVAVGYLISAVTYFLQTVATPNQLQRVLFWTLGSVGGASWPALPLPAVVITLICALLVLSAPVLNALAGGEDLASSLGVHVPRAQWMLLVAVAALTAVAVAATGGIAFVGLVVPHVARLLVGSDHRRMLPVTVLLGALALLLSDLVARTVLAPTELPIGVVTAALGAPFFLWLLLKPAPRSSRGAGE